MAMVSPGLLSTSIFRDFASLVYTKLDCFANRFLRKSKAGFREENRLYTGSSRENGQKFGCGSPLGSNALAIFETGLKKSVFGGY
jgi:hypothetical protein